MRKDIKETDVYTFDELSESAKETAREWYRLATADDFVSFDADTVIDDASRMADLLGISMRTRPVKLMGGGTRMECDIHYCVADRSAGANYVGSYSYRTGSARAIAAEAPSSWTNRDGSKGESTSNAELNRIADELSEVQRRNFYQLQAAISRHGRDCYSTQMDIDVERADGKPFQHDDDGETVAQLLRDFADWIHAQLETEWEYRNSNEFIDENILANEYEFTEDGERYV